MKTTDEPIIAEVTLSFPIETVWSAITELPQMHQWFFEQIKNYKPIVGFKTRFDVKSESRVFPHLWKVTKVNPPYLITTNWKYEGYVGNSFVTFQLEEEKEKTKLIVITKIVVDFQDGVPEFSRKSCLVGWNYFLERLNIYLNKN